MPRWIIDALADECELWTARKSVLASGDGSGKGITRDSTRGDFKEVEDGGWKIAECDHFTDTFPGSGTMGSDY